MLALGSGLELDQTGKLLPDLGARSLGPTGIEPVSYTHLMHAIEAYYNYEQYPYLAVPVLGQPAVPYMVRYDANSGNNQSTVHQGIRRNYLATINDLDAPVQKTADKTMKITYTLRREES